MKKLLFAIPMLLITGLASAASAQPTTFTVTLKNETTLPVYVGLTNYDKTPFSFNTTVVPAETFVNGTGSIINGQADISFYAQLGSKKTTDSVSVIDYKMNVPQIYFSIHTMPWELIYKDGNYSYYINCNFLTSAPNLECEIRKF